MLGKGKGPPSLPWPNEWSRPDYEWPMVDGPSPQSIVLIEESVAAHGGRSIKEAHADRYVTMALPADDGERMVQRKVQRCECKRRAQVAVPNGAGDPIRVCIICDSLQKWPAAGGGALA